MRLSSIQFQNSLFKGRDLESEWKKALNKFQLPTFKNMAIEFDLNGLAQDLLLLDNQLKKGLNSQNQMAFERQFSGTYNGLFVGTSMEKYFGFSLSRPKPEAVNIQKLIDQERGIHWGKRKISLSRRIRSMRNLNSDYDPMADERNYYVPKLQLDLPHLKAIESQLSTKITRLRVVDLEPNTGLTPHSDWPVQLCTRVHIPLETNESSFFYFKRNGEQSKIHLSLGEVWLVNTGLTHWVFNYGRSVRRHLILCLDGQPVLS